MTPKNAKTIGLLAVVVAEGVIAVRSIKNKRFDSKGLIGAAVWGGVAVLVAGFSPEIGAILGGLLLVDTLILPPGPGQSSAAEILGSLLGGAKTGPRVPPGTPPGNPPGTVGPLGPMGGGTGQGTGGGVSTVQ